MTFDVGSEVSSGAKLGLNTLAMHYGCIRLDQLTFILQSCLLLTFTQQNLSLAQIKILLDS
jgi:hypothetical protein